MTQKEQALEIVDNALSLLNNWTGQDAVGAVNDIRERIMAIPEAPISSVRNSISDCPACGEFRGHGHDDICKALTLIDASP